MSDYYGGRDDEPSEQVTAPCVVINTNVPESVTADVQDSMKCVPGKKIPLWLQKSQIVQPKFEKELTEDGAWDTLVLAMVISGYGKDIFTELLHDSGDVDGVHAMKEMVSQIRQTVALRTQQRVEGMTVAVSPMDVLHAVHHMYTIVCRCRDANGDIPHKYVESLEALQGEAQFCECISQCIPMRDSGLLFIWMRARIKDLNFFFMPPGP